jgi:hypothetical protein
VDEYAKVVDTAGDALGDPWVGVEYAVAAMLQSPMFLYRAELGEPDPAVPGRLRYTGYDMASRLAALLLQSIPDDALLNAAAGNGLLTADGVRAQAVRLLGGPRAREAVLRFFGEDYGLVRLDALAKDKTVFPKATATLGGAMRREIEMSIADLVFDHPGDFRDLFDRRSTFVNAELAALYGVAAPTKDGSFKPLDLPAGGPRAGLFGFAGIMAMNARVTTTSPTLRGVFVREQVMCQKVPDPPPNVNTNLPDPGPAATTTRQQLEQHRADPNCAACHAFMDPIGVAMERFDGIGMYRATENGVPIDERGDIDGQPFTGPLGLAALLHARTELDSCLARQLFRFAAGHVETDGEVALLDGVARQFRDGGHDFQNLVANLVTSEAFRFARAE